MHNLPGPKTGGPDMIRAMSTELWLEFLAIRLDPQQVANLAFAANFVTPDSGERFAIELRNSALTSIAGQQVARPDFTVTINRSDLEAVMAGRVLYVDLVAQGKAQFTGDRDLFERFRTALATFPANFEIMPGTAPVRPGAPSPQTSKPDPVRQEATPGSSGS